MDVMTQGMQAQGEERLYGGKLLMHQRINFLFVTTILNASALCCILFLAVSCYGSDNPPKLRLSEVEDVAPVAYTVDLTLDPSKATFTGLIDIKILVAKPVQTLWLNANKINILDASATAASAKLTAKTVPGGDDFLGFEFESAIPQGPAQIRISYSGIVRQGDTSGIFHLEDKRNHYIYTQFESTDARDAFPCFDEPSFKTPWQLTLRVPAQDSAVSNTPPVSETTEGGTKKYVFKETKPLPSYLIAFAVGPFEFVNAGVAGRNRFPVRIVTPKGSSSEAKYAAEVTATILTRLEDYFGIPYPYEKSDQVAVPVAGGFGAMENAGMVTYGQTIILADPAFDTITRQRSYASTAAHELSHQWFGDLVTMEWWNDTWLNEAFATWMQQKLIAEWKPEWKSRIDDVDSKLLAEDQDSLIAARSIRQPIESKGDIDSAFDTITYQKGAAVIGMFESRIGPSLFQEGVRQYLHQYAYKNADAADFLNTLSTVGKSDVKDPFYTFLNQAGVPVVSISLDCSRKAPKLYLEQKRFLPLGSKSPLSEIWSIPVCIRYGAGMRGNSECILMTQAVMDWPLKSDQGCPAWMEANDEAKGYYRVNYSADLLKALTAGNVSSRLKASERVDLVGNAYAMARAGELAADQALALVEKFHADPERNVLEKALEVALSPQEHAVPPDLIPNYRRFLLKNFQSRAHELGWIPKQGESDDVRLLRPRLVRAVATYGDDQELAKQARELTERWFQNHAAVNPQALGAVLETAAYFGDELLFKRYFEEFKKTQDKQDKQRLLRAMTSFRDRAAVELAMESGMKAVLSQEISLTDAYPLLFRPGHDDPETRGMPFAFLKAHYDEIMKGKPSIFGFEVLDYLPGIGSSFCDTNSRNELRSYFEPRLSGRARGQRTLAQVLEGIDQCIAITAVQNANIVDFLKKY
jgi:alanyl aminopeptidase